MSDSKNDAMEMNADMLKSVLGAMQTMSKIAMETAMTPPTMNDWLRYFAMGTPLSLGFLVACAEAVPVFSVGIIDALHPHKIVVRAR